MATDAILHYLSSRIVFHHPHYQIFVHTKPFSMLIKTAIHIKPQRTAVHSAATPNSDIIQLSSLSSNPMADKGL